MICIWYREVGRWSLSHDAMCDIPCTKFDVKWLRQDRCMKWRVKIQQNYYNFFAFLTFFEMRARSIWAEALHSLFLSIESFLPTFPRQHHFYYTNKGAIIGGYVLIFVIFKTQVSSPFLLIHLFYRIYLLEAYMQSGIYVKWESV